MRIRIRNITYESVPKAAVALGVTEGAVYSAIQRGRPDTCGIGRGSAKAPSRHKGGRPKRAVKIGPHTWPSARAAGRALGCSHQTVLKALDGKHPARFEILLQRAMRIS